MVNVDTASVEGVNVDTDVDTVDGDGSGDSGDPAVPAPEGE